MLTLALTVALVTAEPKVDELLVKFEQEFVLIEPGKGKFPVRYGMGRNADEPSERPLSQVTLPGPFSMAAYEVSQELFTAVMGSNPSRWPGPRNAVDNVSYAEAEQFCQQVTLLLRKRGLIEPTETVRLPSEAEWEYCCRAGSESLYSFGDDPAELDDYGWHHGNAAGNDPPVGAKQPNAWGLYDMHGYLWEWCADYWNASHEGAAPDGRARRGRGDARKRVLRGGSWKDSPERLYSSSRRSAYVTTRDDALGFRCVLSEQTAEPLPVSSGRLPADSSTLGTRLPSR